MTESTSYTNVDAAFDILVGLAFCLGVIGSCLPQHFNCWKARSAEGLSLTTLNVATLCFTSRFVASLLEDCDSVAAADGFLKSFAAAMPTLQIALMILFTTPSYTIYYFLWYTPPVRVEVADDDESSLETACELVDSGEKSTKEGRESPVPCDESLEAADTPVLVSSRDCKRADIKATMATVCLALLIVATSIMGLIYPDLFHRNFQIKLWGVVGAATNAILWLPQVLKTWRLKSGGVLSVPTLCVAAFGDLVLVCYWIKLGESFWIWSSPVSDSMMQMLLIGMIIHFRRRTKKGKLRRSRSSLERSLVREESEVDEYMENPKADIEAVGRVTNYSSTKDRI